ncbi:MAG: nucleotidyltransferase substrate binding protein, partial [Ginsengibacter sp.]
LLRKILKPYFHSSKEADKLNFKEVFRHAVLRSILKEETCERWMIYRDNRNHTAHDYGVNFAQETLSLLPAFIRDASDLSVILKHHHAA